jgi:hypothetical protein
MLPVSALALELLVELGVLLYEGILVLQLSTPSKI